MPTGLLRPVTTLDSVKPVGSVPAKVEGKDDKRINKIIENAEKTFFVNSFIVPSLKIKKPPKV
jgi:hypothetical protein